METRAVSAVHTPGRLVRRAIDSVLADENSAVIAVAHNVEPGEWDIPGDDRVTVIEHASGTASPLRWTIKNKLANKRKVKCG